MKGRLNRIHVEGFRSLKYVELVDLTNLTVLIGSNGAGKSNFIRFFDLLSWMLKGQNLQLFIGDQGGADDQLFMGAKYTSRMSASLSIETDQGLNEYKFTLSHAAGDRLIFVEEAYRFSKNTFATEARWSDLDIGGTESRLVDVAQTKGTSQERKKTAQTIVYLLRECVAYQFHDTSKNAFIKQSWDVTDSTLLRSHGGNLPAVLLRLKEEDVRRYKLIERQISRVLPSFGGFDLVPSKGKVGLRWQHKNGGKTIGAHLTSDGSLRLFCLITLLNLPTDMLPDVILLDEPELGLHPNAITLVAAMIKRVSHSSQVILATQSPFMVNCFDLDNIVVADLENGATCLRKLSKQQYQQWLDDDFSVSELWLSNVLGGQP